MSVQYIENSERNKIFAQLKKQHSNDQCIECNKKTKWASINLAIFLCFDCSGKHRQFGPKLSLVRSLDLDQWTERQILFMQQGGNSKILDYLQKHGVISGNSRQIDWENNQTVKKYKAELAKIVDQIEGKNQQQQQKKQDLVAPTIVAAATVQQEISQDNFFDKEEKEQKEEVFKNNLAQPNTKIKTSNVVFASKKGNTGQAGKKIKAQKIDDFDWDSLALDDNVQEQKKETKKSNMNDFQLYEEEQSSKKESEKNDFFSGESSNNGFKNNTQNNSSSNNNASDNFEKYKQKNAKAISSSQFFNQNQETSQEDKQKLSQFNGSQAISSNSYFNRQENEDEEEEDNTQQHIDNIKNFFWNVKEKTSGAINKVKENWK